MCIYVNTCVFKILYEITQNTATIIEQNIYIFFLSYRSLSVIAKAIGKEKAPTISGILMIGEKDDPISDEKDTKQHTTERNLHLLLSSTSIFIDIAVIVAMIYVIENSALNDRSQIFWVLARQISRNIMIKLAMKAAL
ncbi:hypothetical protein HYD_6200 [Candidatus Hydrogenosomobacter endosymbioticus]|uniref:Uncharacterized protein n=1 Tax=Candidatus Hydrogenosomobacter endosymbioticus TaxID=2558174 RepID=A0ABM7V9L5_9PROT|nr:hypothetical protein HYD_6200 [Candidatus Hydrogenosomobacter endosymbioticus]